MAKKLCPCDCGRKVPFGKGGAAAAFRNVVLVSNACSDAARANISKHPVEVQESLRTTVDEGDTVLLGQLLEHLHGEARPGQTLDLMAIQKAMKNWEYAMTSLAKG